MSAFEVLSVDQRPGYWQATVRFGSSALQVDRRQDSWMACLEPDRRVGVAPLLSEALEQRVQRIQRAAARD